MWETLDCYVPILHPCQRDTGKVAAQGPNIMSPMGRTLPPEGCRGNVADDDFTQKCVSFLEEDILKMGILI